jgi:hypothetical protein
MFGVHAEQQSLEGIAKPLTAEEAEAALAGGEGRPQRRRPRARGRTGSDPAY